MSALEKVVAQIALVTGYICAFCTLILTLFFFWMWIQVSLAH